eukprot:g25107.t1
MPRDKNAPPASQAEPTDEPAEAPSSAGSPPEPAPGGEEQEGPAPDDEAEEDPEIIASPNSLPKRVHLIIPSFNTMTNQSIHNSVFPL